MVTVMKKQNGFNVVAWGGLAEVCNQHLRKGQQVYVEGRLQTRRWEDAEGNKHYTTELVAKEMIMLGEGRIHQMNRFTWNRVRKKRTRSSMPKHDKSPVRSVKEYELV